MKDFVPKQQRLRHVDSCRERERDQENRRGRLKSHLHMDTQRETMTEKAAPTMGERKEESVDGPAHDNTGYPHREK